jgi:hypothetical protein
MPSLRGHMVFISHFRDVLAADLPALGRHVADEWPAALLGSQGPDGWFFVSGAARPSTHMLDKDDPTTWPGWFERWLEQHVAVRPGRNVSPAEASFFAGYLSHLGLDVWSELYFESELPPEMRRAARREWYPPELPDGARVRAGLRHLGEVPFPRERIVDNEALHAAAAAVPAAFNPDAILRVAVGTLPSLALDDPWESSRVSALREMPRTAEARMQWEAQRAGQTPATDEEYKALLAAASDFTLGLVRAWWQAPPDGVAAAPVAAPRSSVP